MKLPSVLSFLILALGVAEADQRPNILLIMADDMGYSDLGCYGSQIQTPNIDRLAAEGLRFSRFHNTGRCCPSRASLLTGLYSHQAGVGHMMGKSEFPAYSDELAANTQTIPEVLSNAGYHTFMSGKWHLGWTESGAPNQRGFQRFFGSRGYVDSYFSIVPKTDIYLDNEIILPEGKIPRNPLHPEREFYTTDTYTDYAIHFIDEHLAANPDQPFFGYIAHNAPHFPLHAKLEDVIRYQGRFLEEGWEAQRQHRFAEAKARGLVPEDVTLPEPDFPEWESLGEEEKRTLDFKFALYCAIIDRLDQNVGRLTDHLREVDQLKNTVVIFLSDNGSTKERQMFGMTPDHTIDNYQEWGREGGWTSSLGQAWANVANTPFREYKRQAHEGGTASPLIIWTGEKCSTQSPEGQLTHQVAHIIDLLPTIAELAEANIPRQRNGSPVLSPEGSSLVPVLRGEELGARTLFWEHEGNRAILEGDWKLVASDGAPWELYELSGDRTETNNLSSSEAERAAELEGKWTQWADRVGVQPWNVVWDSILRIRKNERKNP